MTKKKTTNKAPAKKAGQKRSRLSQSDVPSYSLTDAMKVAGSIFENYGGDATPPLEVAAALDLTPTSSGFRMICGASIAYGLTEGGYNASEISVTDLARRIFEPVVENDDLPAKREAFLKPKVISEFLKKYDSSPIPKKNIGENVLAGMNVPRDRTSDVFDTILDEANKLGLVREIKGKKFGHLKGMAPPAEDVDTWNEELEAITDNDAAVSAVATPPVVNNKVFITHGKDRALVEPIKKLLDFGNFKPVVSVDKQSVSKPVPDKVMDDMRECSAAIIHVDDDRELIDVDGNKHTVLNPNVLIEIGAAMALYGRKFILLVKDGTKLPSNLQGLYEVRYAGDTLDSDGTIRLMEAIRELRKSQ